MQTAVEALYQLMRDNITGSAMDDKMARKWFPFIGTLFLFILFSNLIGYIPLPTNTEHEINVFGPHIPSFSLYAATANLSIPLVLALIVFVSYTVEGVRAKGPIGYLKGLVPGGVTGGMAVFIFGLEVLSNLMRILSLSIRLFANILAGHLIILFMAGALAVLLGVAVAGLVHAAVRHHPLRLRGGPGRRPAGVHLRHPHRDLPRRRGRRRALKETNDVHIALITLPGGRPKKRPRPASRSASVSVEASAPSAPVSASASSSGRRSRRSPASPRCATRSRSCSGSASR